ncbi:hypothetical protein [Nocardia farcinica]|uniref:hypothetical protein n=1 Tax=Nocardia farcinica TaxID=37329 RepID=UPI0024581EA0|nr:hypothetical protein [Nocardia farcinica]
MTLADTCTPVTVLLDPTDDAVVTHALLGVHDPTAGVVVVHPTPATSAATALGADLLAALGRSVARRTGERVSGGEAVWHALAAWLIADRIVHLVVLRAHRLHHRQYTRLLQLRWLTGAHLVLVWHTHNANPSAELDLIGIPHQVSTDLPGLIDALKPHGRHQPWLVTDHGDLPAVPLVDFAESVPPPHVASTGHSSSASISFTVTACTPCARPWPGTKASPPPTTITSSPPGASAPTSATGPGCPRSRSPPSWPAGSGAVCRAPSAPPPWPSRYAPARCPPS